MGGGGAFDCRRGRGEEKDGGQVGKRKVWGGLKKSSFRPPPPPPPPSLTTYPPPPRNNRNCFSLKLQQNGLLSAKDRSSNVEISIYIYIYKEKKRGKRGGRLHTPHQKANQERKERKEKKERNLGFLASMIRPFIRPSVN